MIEPPPTQPEFLPRRQVLEAVSWRVAAELVRRHPKRLRIVETHPGGGQYDCLSIVDRRGPDFGHIDLNRVGGVHVHRRFDRPESDGYHRYHGFWGAYLAADPVGVVRALEARAGLPEVVSLPASSAHSLSARLAAACLAPVALGLERWEWRSGFCDSSGVGGSAPRDDLFQAFPQVGPRRAIRLAEDPLPPECRFWFLLQDGEPVVALESVGTIWTNAAAGVDLRAVYRASGRRLTPVVQQLIGARLG